MDVLAGKRYKFVGRADNSLAIAQLPASASSNEYVHPILGEGGPVQTAGTVRIDRESKTVTEKPRYGVLMAEVAVRSSALGRAATAGRYELAEFERGEIEEVFEEDLPRAELPRESQGVNLGGVAQALAETNLPELKKAIESRDPAALKSAYANAAATCNACHRASGHGFVEIPIAPGQSVPSLDPIPAHPR